LKDLQADINAAIKLENKLKDEKFIDEIKTVLKIAKIGFIDAAGNALHRLHETKPTIDAVKELIQGFPDALSFKNEKNRLPVQSALWRNSAATKYVPILAKEGIKHEVGGRGMRGGLLHADPRDSTDHCNTLQMLSSVANMGDADDPIPDDTARHEVMKKLRKGNLLLKQDIRDQHLLYWSCHLDCKMRFSFFAEWDPDCLMTGEYKDLPLYHAIIKNYHEDDEIGDTRKFHLFLQNSLRHHPQHLGLLFYHPRLLETVYEKAVEKYGKHETFEAIQQCIPADTSLPIIHHVMKDAPQCINDFTNRYPSAIYLRDGNERSFIQAQLAEGTKTFDNNGLFFLRLSDDEIAEADPVTKQYPFLTAASGASGDLLTTYFLLSKNPSLLERYTEEVTQEARAEQEARVRKRKRDTGNEEREEKEKVE